MLRLLLVFPNWIGDALMATTVVRAARLRYPEAHIVVVCVPRVAEVLRSNPRINRIIRYDERGRDRSVHRLGRLLWAIKREQCDTAILLRPSLSRTLLVWFAGVTRRIGAAHPKSAWLLTDAVPVSREMHRAETYLRLLTALDPQHTVPTGRGELHLTDEERAWARTWLETHGLSTASDRPLICLHPAGNWDHKRWPVERYGRLAQQLMDRFQAQVLITGAPDDAVLVADIRRLTRAPIASAVGDTTLRTLAAVMECADLIVTNDTGPLHMAAALDRPFVGLFGPTAPAVTGPYGATRGEIVHHPDACPSIPCYSPNHPPHGGMSSIGVEEVLAAVERQLAASPVESGRAWGQTPQETPA